MAAFQYQGRNASGEQVNGTVEASNESAVATLLVQQRIIVTNITASSSKNKTGGIDSQNITMGDLLGFAPVSLDELIMLCRQMYALMKAGVPILRAIKGIGQSSSNAKLKKALLEISMQLESGHSLSSALSLHNKIFAPLFISIIHVGENTGQLDGSFLKLAGYFEREQETRKRIKAALRYPSFVLLTIAAAVVILNVFVIPTFASMFSKLGADLPLATQFLMTSSNFFVNYWLYLVIITLGSVVGIRFYVKTKSGGYQWDKIKLKLPIVGSVIERSIMSRFTHSFAIVLKAGVPMTTGLTLVADAIDNTFMREKILTMRQGIENGISHQG
jgi:MSHA biogenesis protein MshG